MAFIMPAIAGLSALAGLFGFGKSSTSTSNFNSSTTPTYTPAQQSLMSTLMNNYQNEVTPAALANYGSAYTAAGTKNIQTAANSAEQTAADALAARGINNTTAGAGVTAGVGQSEAQNLSSFLNQAPLLLDQRTQGLLSSAGGFLSSLPVGSTTSGSSTTKGTTAPSFTLPGLLTGGAAGTAAALGQQSANNSLAAILKSINNPVTPQIPAGSTNPSTATQIGSLGSNGGTQDNEFDDWSD